MRPWLSLLGAALMLLVAAEATPVAAQGIMRSQTNRTIDAIQNQIRQAVKPHLAVRNPAGAVQSLALSPDGKLLAIVYADNAIRLFDLQAGMQRVRVPAGTGRYQAIAITGDNRFIVSGSDNGSVSVWDATTGAKVHDLQGHSGAVNAIVSAADGSVVATAGADGTVRLWVPATGQALQVLRGHSGPVLSLAFSADGKSVLSGGADGKAMLWSRADGKAIATLDAHSGKVVAVGFDSTGSSVTTDEGGAVHIWAPNGTAVARTFRSVQQATGAQVTTDGHYVAMSGPEGKATLHDIDSGREVKQFAAPSGSARYVIVDVQRKRLIMGGADGMVRVWNIGDGANVAQIISTVSGWAVLDQQGRFDGSQQGVNDVAWIANQAQLPIDNFSQRYYEPGLLAKDFSDRPAYVSDATTAVADGIYLPPQSAIKVSPGPYQPGQSVEVTITSVDVGGGVGNVRLFLNGKLVPRERLVSERDDKANNAKVHEAVYRVPLVTGNNGFEAVAANEQGIDGMEATALVPTPGSKPLPTLHIVTIGINKYKDSGLDLNYGAPDALAVLAAFKRSSGTVFARIIEYRLTDDAATRQNILQMLSGLASVSADDEVVIFYAGHGEIFDKEWYLIPYDVSLVSDQAAKRSSISADELRDAIVRIGAERILLIVDACKSGGSVDVFAGSMDRKVLHDVARDAGIAVLAAARPDQLAAELPKLGHGAFTYVVLQGLSGRADRDPADGQITVAKILRYSLETLPAITEQLGTLPQVPMAYRRGSDFIVKTSVGG
jgi:WD40 repeat protein